MKRQAIQFLNMQIHNVNMKEDVKEKLHDRSFDLSTDVKENNIDRSFDLSTKEDFTANEVFEVS